MAHHDNATFEWIAQEVCGVAQDFLSQVTQGMMTMHRGDVTVGYVLFDLRVTLLAISNPITADRVLQRVLDNCPPMCAWMVAVVYDRVGSLFRLANDVANESINENFLKGAIWYLALCRKWSSIAAIFERRPQCVYEICVRRLIVSMEKDPAGVEFFRTIVRHAEINSQHAPQQFMASLVHDIMMNGLVEQFKVLAYSLSPTVRTEVATNLKSFMVEICTERVTYGIGDGRNARFGACFMAAVKAGLFAAADPETGIESMVNAAATNQPDLVLCLHHCGTLTNRDFSAMLKLENVKAIGSKDPSEVLDLPGWYNTVPFDEEAKKTAFGIKSFLTKQASNPLPLKMMCLQHLSKELGWGHGREEKIREMDIPDTLKDDLRFKGLEKILRKEKERKRKEKERKLEV